MQSSVRGSGWFIHPGKLKHGLPGRPGRGRPGSGWFIHPGKLKPEGKRCVTIELASSGWFIHPGKLKHRRGAARIGRHPSSGWFIHPGKLKQPDVWAPLQGTTEFRMVYPSGEVETHQRISASARLGKFRMVYPSGEVETNRATAQALQQITSSGWFIHPGKLKPD